MNRKGQGTIEYLIIIAIVVVIALVVVGLLTGFFQTGSGVTTTQQQIGQQTQNIALTETAVNPDGEFLLQIVSNESETIEITKITIDGVDQNFYSNNEVGLGDSKIFLIDTGAICNEGTNKIAKNITLTYVGTNGVTKKHIYENVTIPCNAYELTDTTDVASTQNVIGLSYCKNSGWESNTIYRLTSIPTSNTASGSGASTDSPDQQAGTFTNCFSITSSVSNITIDCQNKVITGNGSWTGVYLSSANNITIKNCEFNNFSTGIGLVNGSNATVQDTTLENQITCASGTTLLNGGGNTISSTSGCSSYQ